MTRNKPGAAIATLVRWREFEQERAAIAFQSRSHQASLAQSRSQDAQADVERVHAHLNTILEGRSIDISRLQWVAQIEDAAWQQLQAAQAELAQIVEAQTLARGAHIVARAQTEIAETRFRHQDAVSRDRDEKAVFDRMAELYRPMVRRP